LKYRFWFRGLTLQQLLQFVAGTFKPPIKQLSFGFCLRSGGLMKDNRFAQKLKSVSAVLHRASYYSKLTKYSGTNFR
jgi:hypothetical protein